MSKYRQLTHVYYKCDYHIVFTPKYRFRILEGMIKSLVEHDLTGYQYMERRSDPRDECSVGSHPFGVFYPAQSFSFRIYGCFEG